MKPQPKVKTARDAKYLVFIRTLPCAVCRSPFSGQCHHTESGGMAITGSDYSAVPICTNCHREIHQHKRKDDIPNLPAILEKLQVTYKLAKGL